MEAPVQSGETAPGPGEVANVENDYDFNADVEARREAMQPTRMESFMAIAKSLILRALVIYFITYFFRRPATPPQSDIASGPTVLPSKIAAWNIFENGSHLDMFIYVSEKEDFIDFNQSNTLVWMKQNLVYGDWSSGENSDGTLTHSTNIQASDKLKNNGSIFMHIYVTRHGKTPDPTAGKSYAGHHMSYTRKLLNKFKKLRYTKTHNLLTGETDKSEEEQRKSELMKEEILSHWHPNITINLVTDQTNWVRGTVPAPLDDYINFLPGGKQYQPVVFVNEFWNMLRDYQPINSSSDVLPLHITYQPLSLFKWQLYSAQAMRNKWTSNMLGDAFAADEQDEDQDTLKEALLDTNPYLLGLTVAISILHSIFELLAFKNDIQFWNNRKSLEGLSVRSVFFNVFQSLIVLLYVLDNETNTMVRLSCFVGLGIEVWKIHKVMDIKVDKENKIFGVLPRLSFKDKGSYVESSTRQYDMLAFQYLSWACFPLLIGYGVYSVTYQEHKGWYSFTLNMLYGYLLTFGFIMMTPQLFINYKMKSVAHLPWRMMSYKFLNTFIDDIFAFVIKMPTLYRLGCFRDDIVFFIFLYQRWIYKVDTSRVNEFGFSGDMEHEAKQKSLANGAPAAIEPAPAPEPEESKPLTQKKKD